MQLVGPPNIPVYHGETFVDLKVYPRDIEDRAIIQERVKARLLYLLERLGVEDENNEQAVTSDGGKGADRVPSYGCNPVIRITDEQNDAKISSSHTQPQTNKTKPRRRRTRKWYEKGPKAASGESPAHLSRQLLYMLKRWPHLAEKLLTVPADGKDKDVPQVLPSLLSLGELVAVNTNGNVASVTARRVQDDQDLKARLKETMKNISNILNAHTQFLVNMSYDHELLEEYRTQGIQTVPDDPSRWDPVSELLWSALSLDGGLNDSPNHSPRDAESPAKRNRDEADVVMENLQKAHESIYSNVTRAELVAEAEAKNETSSQVEDVFRQYALFHHKGRAF